MKVIMWPLDEDAQAALTRAFPDVCGFNAPMWCHRAFPVHPARSRELLDRMARMSTKRYEAVVITDRVDILNWCWQHRVERCIEIFVWRKTGNHWGMVPVTKIKNEEYLNQFDLGELYMNCFFEED